MRTKRFFSLLLALSMLAVMTISASADGTVYYVQQFDYADGTEMAENIGTSISGIINGVSSTANLLAAKETDGVQMWTSSNSSGSFTSTRSGFWTAANGTKMFKQLLNSGDYGEMHYAFDNEWNMFENKDEIFVVSMDMVAEEIEDLTAASNNYYGMRLYTRTAGDEFESSTHGMGGYYVSAADTEAGTSSEFTFNFYPYAVNSSGVIGKSFVEDQVYRLAFGYWCDPSVTEEASAHPVRRYTFDGAKVANDNKDTTKAPGHIGKSIFSGMVIVANNKYNNSYGNIRVYTIKNTTGAFNASIASEMVPTSAKKVTVKFSQPVAPATYDADAVTVTANGVAMEEGSYTVTDIREVVNGTAIYSEADVIFEELDESSEYVITFPETISNEMLTTLEGYNTVTFSTPEPDIKINGFDIIKGWDGEAEQNVESFTADGSLQGASIAVENTTEAEKNVAIIYAIYASNGQLTDVVYANGTLAAKNTTTVDAGVTLANEGTVKAFIWDGISSLKPHSEATVKTIAAAAE